MKRMPTIFIGHGSPMNAIQKNDFTENLMKLGQEIDKPISILCISAHWMTEGTWVTNMKHPKTIHDFYGFPQELFDVQYPALGCPELASQIKNAVTKQKIILDDEMWGLDHGAWSILRHIYPNADVPVVQLSLYLSKPSSDHFNIGTELRKLREQGVLIVGSGNIVHNLQQIQWDTHAKTYDWALEFDLWFKQKLENREFNALIQEFNQTSAGKLSVPTVEHYLPLLYILGASDEKDQLTWIHEEMQNASISMRSFAFGI
jgi:4,5-DOPA dioxygenase extradiol